MALIKCPECGNSVSDKAVRCPKCGFPLDEINAATQESSIDNAGLSLPPKEKKRMPTWLLVLIILCSVLLIGGIVFLCFNGKSEESAAPVTEQEIPIPNITEQGVEPFLLGLSMFDIPVKGSFYDTLLLEKRYSAFAYSTSYDDLTESQVQDFKKEWGDNFEVTGCVGVAKVVKGSDTIMTINFTEEGVITSIEVLTNSIQLENGVHVGLSATEMFNTYKACYISPGLGSLDNFGYGKQQFYYTDLPNDIYIMASTSKAVAFLESNGSEVTVRDRFYFSIPLENVKDDSVRSIIINKNMVISCMDGMEM